MQNIPSHNREIRMLFCANIKNHVIEVDDTEPFCIHKYDEVEIPNGWKKVKDLTIDDTVIVDNHQEIVYNITQKGDYYYVETRLT